MLVATASLSSIAYSTSRAIIERGAMREVGITVNARRQALIGVLAQQRARAAGLLKTASLGCLPQETLCVRRLLTEFLATEGATAVQLAYKRRSTVVAAGDGKLLPTAVLAAGQIAQFEFDQAGRPYYLIAVRDVTVDGEVTITLRGDMRVIDQIFGDRYGLGQSGETWPRELRVVLNWFEELRQRAPAARWHKPLTRFALCDHRTGVSQAR